MAPVKNNKTKKRAASTPDDSDEDKPRCEKTSHLSVDHSGTISDPDKFPLDIQPTKEFSSLAISVSKSLSKNATPTCSPGGRKRSFRKLSLENSPQIPLNDDCSELIKEKEKSELEQEKSLNKSTAKVTGDEEQELSIIQTMSMEQIQEHISRCLQLSTENKINAKNAFALKLIDCMTVTSKNDDEKNFAAMACQLDAGAKIYSHRVDAVHQDVMKLLETCTLAEKRGKKKKDGEQVEVGEEDSDNEDNEGTSNDKVKGKKRKAKKKMIATFDQINRKQKENDPREMFVKLEALPGDILQKAKRNPNDLSLTLDKHIPFWMDWQNYSPTKADGESEIPHIVIKCRKLGPALEINPDVDLSSIPKFEPMLILKQDDEDWYDDLVEDYDNSNEKGETSSSTGSNMIIEDRESEVEVISLAKMKMSKNSSSEPSRLDVIKALFHRPGESDYHYLKMDNSYFWAGPSYWKRPQGINHAANKRKIGRKKKEALAIEYTEEAMKKSLEVKPSATVIAAKRSTTLSKRSLAKWTKKKVTYPLDIFFKPQSFNIAFHINIVAQVLLTDTVRERDPPAEEPHPEEETNEENDNPDSSESENMPDDDPPDDDPPDDDPPDGDPPEGGQDLETEKTAENDEEDDDAGPSTSAVDSDPSNTQGAAVAGPSDASSCDNYEGENLVPMVKRVHVNPIRCVPKPNRVDMQHLKEVMVVIIEQALDKEEERMRSEGIENPHAVVAFKNILPEVMNSDLLHYRTREDLTMQMTFLGLLTVTNDNNFMLKNDESGDVEISRYRNEGHEPTSPVEPPGDSESPESSDDDESGNDQPV